MDEEKGRGLHARAGLTWRDVGGVAGEGRLRAGDWLCLCGGEAEAAGPWPAGVEAEDEEEEDEDRCWPVGDC